MHTHSKLCNVDTTVAVETSEFNDSTLLSDTGGSTVVKFLQITFQGHLCLRITDACVLG